MKRLLFITSILALVLGAATVLQAKEITVRGKLQKTVEAGGWLIVGDTKYLILNPANFQKNDWFKESAKVEAVGEVKEVMTTFMEGTPFEVKTMQPADQAVATHGASENKRLTRVMVVGDWVVQAQPETAILRFQLSHKTGPRSRHNRRTQR